jgi:hypothetical protein
MIRLGLVVRSAGQYHVSYPVVMTGSPYYAEAFSPLPDRSFRMVAHPGETGPTHCPRQVAWRGSWWAPNGRRYRIEACEGPSTTLRRGQPPHRLASGRLVAAGAQVQEDAAALPLDLIDLALAVVLTTGLEGQQFGVPRERLECGQHVLYCHSLSVA